MRTRVTSFLVVTGVLLSVREKTAYGVATCGAIITHMEVTQAIQLDPRATTTKLPLVSGRLTTARLYGRDLCPWAPTPVEGWLRVTSANSGALVWQATSENGPIYFPWQPSAIDRTNANSTLNFTFLAPSGGTTQLQFQALAKSCAPICTGVPDWSQESAILQQTVQFEPRVRPKFVGIPIEYNDQKPNIGTYKAGVGDPMLWDMWPFPDIGGGGYEARGAPPIITATHQVTLTTVMNKLTFVDDPNDNSSHYLRVGDAIKWTNQTGQSHTIERRSEAACTYPKSFSTVLPAHQSATLIFTKMGCLEYKLSDVPGVNSDTYTVVARDDIVSPWTLDLSTGAATTILADKLDQYRLKMTPPVDYLYGWLCCPDENPYKRPGSGFQLGESVGKAGHGTTETMYFQKTYAHELGHQFGLFTDGNHPTGTIQTNEPYALGWSVIDRLGRSGSGMRQERVKLGSKRRVMEQFSLSPSGPPYHSDDYWIHPSEWTNVLEQTHGPVYPKPPAHFGIPFSRTMPPYQEFFTVSGLLPVDPNLPIVLNGTSSATNYVEFVPGNSGSLTLSTIDAQGNALYSTSFDPNFEPESTAASFSVVVPAGPSVQRIQLKQNMTLVGELVRSPHAPIVQIIEPSAGTTMGARLRVVWNASDEDQDTLSADVLYSHDQGATWTPLVIDKTDGDAIIYDTSQLPASTGGWIKVAVSDGMNTTATQVTGLVIGNNHPPTVDLVNPADGATYRQGSLVDLLGSSHDLEDGWLNVATGEQIVPHMLWSSNRDGLLGQGEGLNISSLSLGLHIITLTTTDSNGATNEATRSITIVPR
jgi:hypothetical protein